MSKPIIEVENLSKCYRIGANKEPYLSLRDEVAKFASRLRPENKYKGQSETDFWALIDVSFTVQEGEAVGIIGRNGAGKSTLLKILSQITPPTKGHITMRGRVASLLEVGTGFHPELTGRENIFLNGAILGMSREEVRRKFDEIVAFAEVEKFLDTPVKRYSSGMYVRLAFAVAAHLEPEILVVDEVLAVGDAEFQNKSLGKMSEVAKGGRTVLFVSHNMAAVNQLCSRGVVIAQGKIDFCGTSNDAIRHYLQSNVTDQGKIRRKEPAVLDAKPARIVEVELTNGNDEVCTTLFIGDTMTLRMKALFTEKLRAVQLSFIVKSLTKGNIYHCVTRDAGFYPDNLSGEVIFSATFPSVSLYPGTYVIDELWLATHDSLTLDYIRDVVSFQVCVGGTCVTRDLGAALHAAVVHEVPQWNILR